MDSLIQTLAISALPVIFAITLHEAAHGYVARYFGDNTAWQAGRISLNPLKHVDPIGTLLVPVMILLVSGGGMLFGWAKPVPVDFGRLRRPKKDMLWVAAAGPAMNFLMALGWALFLKLSIAFGDMTPYQDAMRAMALRGIEVNGVLMILNLIPMPPLDGGRIAVSLLPWSAAVKFSRIEPYGMLIMLALLYFNVLPYLIYPPLSLFIGFLKMICGF